MFDVLRQLSTKVYYKLFSYILMFFGCDPPELHGFLTSFRTSFKSNFSISLVCRRKFIKQLQT